MWPTARNPAKACSTWPRRALDGLGGADEGAVVIIPVVAIF